MRYTRGLVFTDGHFEAKDFYVTDGRFSFEGRPDEETVDLDGLLVLPGLIELHCHGAMGSDFCDGDYEGLKKMAAFFASKGITSFAPASATVPLEVLDAAYRNAARLHRNPEKGLSRLVGINMEGPYFSLKRKGAQNPAYLRLPSVDEFMDLQEAAEGLIRLADVAPELEGAIPYIEEISKNTRVSVAHTDADYEEAAAAFDAGASHLTHLYNTMNPLLHRAPGPIGAASERDDVTAELISDGYHVHPSAVRAAFKLFPGRICLISDGLRCLGLPEGEYSLGGLTVILKDNVARLTDGTIAGSATSLFDCMKRAISFGIPAEEAITAATLTPAKILGIDDELGSVADGKIADFIVVTPEYELKQVYMSGELALSLEL